MTLEEMREIAGIKIYMEYELFKQQMMQKSVDEVYECAYQIDSYINLYEFLLDMCQEFEEREIKVILLTPNILASLYDEWLSFEDSSSEDLTSFIRREVKFMQLTCLSEIELKKSA
jgi:hypothetical protein